MTRHIISISGGPRCSDAQLRTALSIAAGKGFDRIVKSLLLAKADSTLVDRESKSPLDHAKAAEQQGCVSLLSEDTEAKEKGANDSNATTSTPVEPFDAVSNETVTTLQADGTPVQSKAMVRTPFDNDTSTVSSAGYGPHMPSQYSTYSSYSTNYSSAGGYKPGAWSTHSDDKYQKKSASAGGFVGLCNQGATCYMNSLIQALYMTPEFRKALYNWEYNEEFYIEADKCIPFQLRSSLPAQFSERSAVETKGLTASFGWGV